MHFLSVCDMYLCVLIFVQVHGGQRWTLIWCLPQLFSIFSETGFHQFSEGWTVSSKELPISPCQHWDSDTYYFTELCMWMLGSQTHVCMLAWQTLHQLSHLPASLKKKKVCFNQILYALKIQPSLLFQFQNAAALRWPEVPIPTFSHQISSIIKVYFHQVNSHSQFLNNHITLAAEQRRELISTLTTHLKE